MLRKLYNKTHNPVTHDDYNSVSQSR